MKKRIIALGLVLVLGLSGCTAMLEREYVALDVHPQIPSTDGNSDVVWVENYQELLSAILYQVENHAEVGVIRLRDYTGDVDEALTRACEEVSHDDPRGAYAVDRIKYAVEKIVVYHEATITIDFRRTKEQLDSVVTVTGSGAIRMQLQEAMAQFTPEVVLQVNYFNQDTAYIHELIREAYYDSPATAMGMPKTTVTLYPESGLRRVAEVTFSYSDTAQVLAARSESLVSKANDMVLSVLEKGLDQTAQMKEIWQECQDQLVRQAILTGSQAGRTAYDALLGNGANNEGRALALKLLCDMAGIDCVVVQGTLNGESFYWNIAQVGEEYRHMVPGRADGYALDDARFAELIGAQWDLTAYPSCAPEEELPEAGEGENNFEETA